MSIELNNKFFDSYWNRAIIYSFQNKIKKSYKDYKIALSLYNENDFDNTDKKEFIVAKYKLMAKGIDRKLIERYIENMQTQLDAYMKELEE